MGYAVKDGSEKVQKRARQNVILEMGMLLARLGRPRVGILVKGTIEKPSDTSGILYEQFNTHVKETVPWLTKRFIDAGFRLKPTDIAHAGK